MRILLIVLVLAGFSAVGGEPSLRSQWRDMMRDGEKERKETVKAVEAQYAEALAAFLERAAPNLKAKGVLPPRQDAVWQDRLKALADAKEKYLPTLRLETGSMGVFRSEKGATRLGTVKAILDGSELIIASEGQQFAVMGLSVDGVKVSKRVPLTQVFKNLGPVKTADGEAWLLVVIEKP